MCLAWTYYFCEVFDQHMSWTNTLANITDSLAVDCSHSTLSPRGNTEFWICDVTVDRLEHEVVILLNSSGQPKIEQVVFSFFFSL